MLKVLPKRCGSGFFLAYNKSYNVAIQRSFFGVGTPISRSAKAARDATQESGVPSTNVISPLYRVKERSRAVPSS